MRKALLITTLILGTFFLTSHAHAAISLVQSASNHTPGGGGGTSLTVTLPQATAAGDLLVVSFFQSATTTPTTFTDNKSDTYTLASKVNPSSGNFIYYLANTPSGITSVSFTFGFRNFTATVAEYSGVATSNPLDGTSSLDNGYNHANPQSSGNTAALAASDELLLGFFGEIYLVNGGISWTAGTNWTQVATDSYAGGGTTGITLLEQWINPGSASAVAATADLSTTANTEAYGNIATFKAAGGTPPPSAAPTPYCMVLADNW